MSRVEDEREAARAAERLMQQKRAEEAKKQSRAQEGNAFSKLVQSAQADAKSQVNQNQGKFAKLAQAQQQTSAKGAIAKLLEQAHTSDETAHAAQGAADATRGEQSQASLKQGAASMQSRVKEYASGAERQTDSVHEADHHADEQLNLEKAADSGSASAMSASRGSDAKAYNSKLDQRKADSDAAKKGIAGAGNARAEKGDLKTDTDKGGGGGSKDNKGGDPAAASFRFNPALMAPVAVAKANPNQGSDRLRRIATEIAQKIVEKVRVGTNAAGKMEFQIDFRQDVLSGLSVKVSAKNGKISAVFSGSDKEVLKMLEEQAEGLKGALTARGLSLEAFKVEAKG
ncbi:MAG: flagellar hook-length control protein FliK [Myxococcaceae bacterium]